MAVYPAWSKYLHIAAESVWGTKDSSPNYLLVPYLSQTMKATRVEVTADHFCGQREPMHQESVATTVGGNITTNLFAAQDSNNVSLAQHLVSWATNGPTSHTLDSKTIEVYDADVDNKRFLGNRVNSMTLSGAPNQPIQISLDVIGKSVEGGIQEQTIDPADLLVILQSMMFFNTFTFEIPASTELQVEAFSLTVQNNLQPKFLNGTTIAHLTAGLRISTLSFTFPKSANTYDALNRAVGESTTTAQANFQGLHKSTGSTGTKTTLTIDFDRINFNDATFTETDRNQLVMITPSYNVLKPGSSDPGIELTWSEA